MSPRTQIARGVVSAVVAVCAALLLAGCLRSEAQVVVEGDGSGSTSVEVYFDESDLDAAGLSAENMVKLVETATEGVEGAAVASVVSGGSRGFRVTIPFDDYRQLTQALTTGEYGGMSTRLFQSFVVAEGDDGTWSMDATVDPAGFRAVLAQIPAGLTGSTSLVDSNTTFVFAVTLPGQVSRSNADSIDGGTARWELAGDTEAVTFDMETEPAGAGALRWIVIGALSLLVVVLVVVVRSRRRRRTGGPGDGDPRPEVWAPANPMAAPVPVAPPQMPVQSTSPGIPVAPVLPVAPPMPPVAQPPTTAPPAWPPAVPSAAIPSVGPPPFPGESTVQPIIGPGGHDPSQPSA